MWRAEGCGDVLRNRERHERSEGRASPSGQHSLSGRRRDRAAAAGGALFWLATWTLYDYKPVFDDTLGAVLAEVSRGIFIGAGLMASLVVLRALLGIGRLFGRS